MDIKKVIKNHGWTIRRLAEEMTVCKGDSLGKKGISQAALSKLLSDYRKIPYGRIEEIAGIIGASTDEFLDIGQKNILRCPHCGQILTLKAE